MKLILKLIVLSCCFLGAVSPGRAQPSGADLEEVLSLEECLAYAHRNAPGLNLQRLSYSNVVEAVQIARATYDPVFRVRRGWQSEDDPNRTTGSVSQTLPAELDAQFTARHQDSGGNELTEYALRLSKTLLGGGSLLEGRLPIERALIQEAREANSLSLEQRRQLLTVTQNYYAVVRDRLTLRLRQLQLARAERNLEHAKVKEDPLDIATARLRIPESELEVLSTRRRIANGLLDLRDEIGMPVSHPMTVNTQMVYAVRDLDVRSDVARALEEHERVLNARLDLELNEKEFKVARTRRMPEVRVEMTVERTDSALEDDSEARGELVFEWPWLDRRDRAEARQRLIDVEQSEIRLFDTVQDVRKSIESLALRVEEARKSVALQEERVKVLEQQLRLYQDRWENGEINILEYIRSQNDLENARVQLVSQQTRYMELLAEYDFATGR